MNVNLSRLLNQRFECPGCHASDNWSAITRSMVRQTSTIQGFRCRRCREGIVAKVPRTVAGFEIGRQLAQTEYQVLCELQRAFPQDNQFGTLIPLGYMEFDEYGVMITRKFDGVDLVRHAFRLNTVRAQGLFRPAGHLLRKLHDSCPRGYQSQSLGVADKVAYLTERYGNELRGDPATRIMLDQLDEDAARISGFRLRATWGHGDFKSENILYDGHKYLILDTQLKGYVACVYDLASFLDHLLLAGQGVRGAGIRHHYQLAEEAFLAGYGDVDQHELAALRWAQLYFMLCYWGRYRQRGGLSGIYANWRIRPLAQTLAAQL